MGGLLSSLWASDNDPKLDVVDPVSGLTPREKRAIRQTWELVTKDYKKAGIALFMKLFKDHPEYQKKFKAFADVPRDELPNNPRLHAHAAAVLYTMTSFVDNLDDVACLKEQLTKIGDNHFPRGITIQHFENLAVVVIGYFQESFGKRMTPLAIEAWTKVFKVVNSIIGSVLEKHANEKQ